MTPARGLVVIPFVDCWNETHQALLDALAQLDATADVLLVDNGSGEVARAGAESQPRLHPRIRLWQHRPPMPSLAATWNRALDYAWEAGYEDCMVWNNDIRVGSLMYACLGRLAVEHQLWFITPVNCAGGNPEAWTTMGKGHELDAMPNVQLGGPDFSCFLITRECHEKYRFDERFQPAYHEDGDFHRRMWLNGDGARIAGVTLPYLHYGSRTLHSMPPERQQAFQAQFATCRARYVHKWGGEPHHETRIGPPGTARATLHFDNVGTPGGYLDGWFPGNAVMLPCACGVAGYERRIGLRAGGRTVAEHPDINHYVGCAFCTGYANGEQDGGSLG